MMQHAQQVRTKLFTLIMAAVAGAGFATAATAAGAGVNANVDADTQVVARDNAQAGGSADARMSPSGNTNSNAQWQSGAAQGADRAAGRMNPKGAEMKQSSDTEPEATGKAPVKGEY